MLRVMTVNLLNGEGRPSVLNALLERYRPDVLAAQELSANQAEVLEQHFRHGIAKPRDDNEGMALMAQREIGVEVLPLPYRDGFIGRLDIEGESVEVVTMHLANPIDGPTGKFGERRRQLAAVTPRLSLPGRRILLGDMNSTPAWPAYWKLRRHLRDTVADWAASEGLIPQRTWAYRPGWRAMLRIDHVFADGLHATDVKVRNVDGSDHRALIVDLELDRGPGTPP